MATTLLFVRHAETDLAGTFCGSSDPPLNATGWNQIGGLRQRLDFPECSAVYSSDLLRARQTAASLAEHLGLPLCSRPSLRELAFGHWEGMHWEEIVSRDPAYAARWVAEFPLLPAPGGEPIPVFRQRVRTELDWLRDQAATHSILVVTHAAVLRVLLEELGHFSAHHAWERTRDYTCCIRCIQHSPTGRFDIQPEAV